MAMTKQRAKKRIADFAKVKARLEARVAAGDNSKQVKKRISELSEHQKTLTAWLEAKAK